MTKKVYFDHHFGMHTAYWEFVRYPPEGYEYILPNATWDRVFNRLVVHNELLFANPALAKFLGKFMAPRLFKAHLDNVLKKPPPGMNLVFSIDHPVLWTKPWVIHVTWPQAFSGFNVENLEKHRSSIEKQLASPYCKRVITWSELAKKALLLNFDCSSFKDKIEVLPLAIHPQHFTKVNNQNKVRLLFVGTINNLKGAISKKLGTERFFEFDGKGGTEVLEAFLLLREKYPNLELVFRATVPPEIKIRFQGYPEIRFVEEALPREVLDKEFQSADIFLYPTKQLTPWTVFLEAMSFELPIVTTDVYANGEIIQDGVTGLLIKGSSNVPYHYGEKLLIPFGSSMHNQYVESIKLVDPLVVKELAEKTAVLIENQELRQRMGKAARWEAEKGRHSLESRNRQLKKIFDEATA